MDNLSHMIDKMVRENLQNIKQAVIDDLLEQIVDLVLDGIYKQCRERKITITGSLDKEEAFRDALNKLKETNNG